MAKILGIHTPSPLRNLVINGALDFWQEKVGTTTTVNTATTTTGYSADMLAYNSGGPTVKNYSLQRSTDIPSVSQSGFQSTYSNLFTMITGIPSMAASDIIQPNIYKMEGLDYSKIHGKQVTVGFWSKASVAGTYSVSVRNAAANRSYVTTFTASSNTWEFKTISLTLDSVGTWNFDNTLSLFLEIGSCGGSTFTTASINQWQTGNYLVASGATNWMGTSGATLRIAQLSLVEGPIGFSPTGFSRAGDVIEDELAMCQRYYEKSYSQSFAPGSISQLGAYMNYVASSGNTYRCPVNFRASKRIAPTTVTVYNVETGTSGFIGTEGAGATNQATSGVAFIGENSMLVFSTAVPVANFYGYFHWVADSRL